MNRILDVTAHFGAESGIIINKHDLNIENSRKIENMCKEKGVDILGSISYDTIVTDAQMSGVSVTVFAPESEVSKDITRIFNDIEKKLSK